MENSKPETLEWESFTRKAYQWIEDGEVYLSIMYPLRGQDSYDYVISDTRHFENMMDTLFPPEEETHVTCVRGITVILQAEGKEEFHRKVLKVHLASDPPPIRRGYLLVGEGGFGEPCENLQEILECLKELYDEQITLIEWPWPERIESSPDMISTRIREQENPEPRLHGTFKRSGFLIALAGVLFGLGLAALGLLWLLGLI